MKKIFRDFFILFGLFTLWASTSRVVMQWVSDHRDVNTWWGSYQCLNGDLISLSYLDFVSVFRHAPVNVPPATEHIDLKNTDLFLYGDSYSWSVKKTDFPSIANFYYFNRDFPMRYHLDSTKRNVLILEISERMLRDVFKDTHIMNVRDTLPPAHNHYATLFELKSLFNPLINQNLQCNLFNYNFIMPMFETKAALNYYIFNRASGDVVISEDRQFLFLKTTVSKTSTASSYIPIPDKDIDRLADTINKVYDHLIAAGFDEVYLAAIPNCATIMQPDGYNGLIPRLCNNHKLRIGIIDAYTTFKNTPDVLYYHGDTHWNKEGERIWANMVSDQLARAAIRNKKTSADTVTIHKP